jgi:hypothetical protein
MDSPQERRRHPRSEVDWFTTIETSEISYLGDGKNISSGGAFIECEKPLQPGEVLLVSFSIPDRGTSLMGKAEVVWTSRHGMGVKFHPEHTVNGFKEMK